ncbi:MAG TPA: inorganic pyrophosphatase [Myxococcales bacterium]
MSELDKLLDIMFQAHPWHGVSPGDPTGVVQAFIEIVPTDSVKYELDKPSGHLRIDRPQRFSSQPPTLYGFIPQTYCGARVGERCSQRTGQPGMRGDRDPMDVCILTEKSVAHANFLLRARPIGGLRMVDENEADDKIVAVLERDMAYGDLRDIADCPKGIVERLRHYFLTYKQMPGEKAREVRIAEVYDRFEAVEVIRLSLQDYRDTFGAPESRGAALARLLGKT